MQEPVKGSVIVIDDRRGGEPLEIDPPSALVGKLRVVRSGGVGPARARNVGWRQSDAAWMAFLDDDVVPEPSWTRELERDLGGLPASVAGSQGRVVVPLPADRAANDWERGIKGLENATWITADMAYRRSALEGAGGFSPHFPRAYREDSDLALRLRRAGWQLVRGDRTVRHPAARGRFLGSLAKQRGNADDAVMFWLHGPGWRADAGAPRGTLRLHLASVAAMTATLLGLAQSRRRMAALAGVVWAALFARFAAERVAGGPRDPRELTDMTVTSALIPPLALAHSLRGHLRGLAIRLLPRRAATSTAGPPPDAVLFDRDGTLIVDLPYNGDPELVQPTDSARSATQRLRDAGVALGIVTNQSGVGRGLVDEQDVAAVNARVEELLGPFGTWQVCTHAPEADCLCRKPSPELVRRAADALGVDLDRCVVIGDIGSDIEAARAAGAASILVPTTVTRIEEIATAPAVAADLDSAVESLFSRGAL
jgi:histidinol-phosphate phosphatase family protein